LYIPNPAQEFCVIHGEKGIRDARLRRNHSIGERVVRGAAVRLIPAGRKLGSEPEGHCKSRPYANGVLRITRAQKRAPIHLCRRRIKQETGNRSLQKRLQACERRLSKLAQCNCFVRLKLLKPCAEFKLVPAACQGYVVLVGEEITVDGQVASVIASRQSKLSLRVRCRAASNHYRPHRVS
jgi:hypothetical protein